MSDVVVVGLIGLIGTLSGALIGACVVIVNSYLMGRQAVQLEHERAQLARASVREAELRRHIGELARYLQSAQHSMEWITWHATQDPDLIDRELMAQYHAEIHDTFPRILGEIAVIATLDDDLHARVMELAERVFRMDSQLAHALIDHQRSIVGAVETLVASHHEIGRLYRDLPTQLAEIMDEERREVAAANAG